MFPIWRPVRETEREIERKKAPTRPGPSNAEGHRGGGWADSHLVAVVWSGEDSDELAVGLHLVPLVLALV